MWLFVLLIAFVVIALLIIDSKKPANYPPGPKWLPILGSALEIQKVRHDIKHLVRTVLFLAKRYKTSVLGIRIGADRIVITSDIASVKEMLMNEDIDGRPRGIFYLVRTWGERRGITLIDGEQWKDQRRFIVRHLKEFGLGKRAMVNISQTEAEYLLKHVQEQCSLNNNNSAVIQVNDLFGTHILNTLWTMMAGIRYNNEDKDLKILQELLFELFRNVDMVGSLFGHYPFLRYLTPELIGYNRYIQIHMTILDFLNNELNKHIQRFKFENEDCDFMDAYIRVMKSNQSPHYSERQILAICMDMFMAGQETTNKSMGFGFLHLLREQEVQKKAQHEIDTVIGRDRLPSIDDRPNMPYNEAITLESIRHFLGNSFGIPHRAIRDTKLCGYTVPEDTTVVANYYGILMNEKFFKDPKAFRPERFIVDGKINTPDAYSPFGLGKHRCIGEALSKCNMFLFTVILLQNYDFKLVPGDEIPSMEPIDGATPSVQPFRSLVTPRPK